MRATAGIAGRSCASDRGRRGAGAVASRRRASEPRARTRFLRTRRRSRRRSCRPARSWSASRRRPAASASWAGSRSGRSQGVPPVRRDEHSGRPSSDRWKLHGKAERLIPMPAQVEPLRRPHRNAVHDRVEFVGSLSPPQRSSVRRSHGASERTDRLTRSPGRALRRPKLASTSSTRTTACASTGPGASPTSERSRRMYEPGGVDGGGFQGMRETPRRR